MYTKFKASNLKIKKIVNEINPSLKCNEKLCQFMILLGIISLILTLKWRTQFLYHDISISADPIHSDSVV